ncbi:MAG: hypothetical protein MK066_11170, partial [Crocinitomicaceae bacterium]|nr:hypothetical protein [Crocinitomicaceae bacterium]
MFKRVLLIIIFLLSLGWIGYVGFDLFQNSNEYSQEYLFGNRDGQLLIVNRPHEVDFSLIQDFSTSPMIDIISLLNDSLYTTGYFSEKRAHFMLESDQKWTKEKIKSLFLSTKINATNFTNNSFSAGPYNGKFRKFKLYVSNESFQTNEAHTNEVRYDKKASASLIKFDTTGSQQISDIYFKADGKVNYLTRNENIIAGNQVEDEIIFSSYISSKIKSYHFF